MPLLCICVQVPVYASIFHRISVLRDASSSSSSTCFTRRLLVGVGWLELVGWLTDFCLLASYHHRCRVFYLLYFVSVWYQPKTISVSTKPRMVRLTWPFLYLTPYTVCIQRWILYLLIACACMIAYFYKPIPRTQNGKNNNNSNQSRREKQNEGNECFVSWNTVKNPIIQRSKGWSGCRWN